MTPQGCITTARDILNDTDPAAYRQSDEELLRYFNDGMREAAMLAPQLFYATGDMQCAPGETEQGISFADAQALADVVRIKNGNAILLGDMNLLSLFNPNWGQDAAGPAVNWFRHAGDPLRFYIYPKSPDVQIIEIKYVRNPVEVGLTDTVTDLSDTLRPALTQYIVGKAESKDDEHVNSGRASASYQAFVAMLKPA